MDSPHFQQVCTGGLIINDKREILFVKRADDDDFFPGFWELPGGGTDYGELPQKSLQREIKEECGFDVDVSFPLCVHSYTMPVGSKESQRIEVTFLCKPSTPDIRVILSHEHSRYRWIAKESIGEIELSDYMKKVVEDALANPVTQHL